jgi:hypothetical protein
MGAAIFREPGEMKSILESRFEILERICTRGRNYFAEKKETYGVDLFEHIENEIRLLKEVCLESDR